MCGVLKTAFRKLKHLHYIIMIQVSPKIDQYLLKKWTWCEIKNLQSSHLFSHPTRNQLLEHLPHCSQSRESFALIECWLSVNWWRTTNLYTEPMECGTYMIDLIIHCLPVYRPHGIDIIANISTACFETAGWQTTVYGFLPLSKHFFIAIFFTYNMITS